MVSLTSSFVKNIAALFAMFLAVTLVSAQTGTLGGKVSNARTGNGIVGVTVTLASSDSIHSSVTTTTVEGGTFILRKVLSGVYELTVSSIGYSKKVVSDIHIVADEASEVNLSLTPQDIELNPITITALRQTETLLDAPAAVSVVDADDIALQPGFVMADHVEAVPAVDVAYIGINTVNVAVRGFNDIFPQSLLTLTDYRISQIPSLRVNQFQLLAITDDDVERIEVLSGPASALYGPNSDHGIMHIITKSPFESQGMRLSIAVGDRNILLGSIRYAGSINKMISYKISSQYYRGTDWEETDPLEPDSITKGFQTPNGRLNEGQMISNDRNYHIDNLSSDVRIDGRVNNALLWTLSTGVSRVNNIGYSPIGAGQVVNWISSYVQARITYDNLFVNTYMNASNAGDTYNLRNGDLLLENSKLFAAQIHHGFSLGEQHKFTYGVDALFTRPESKSTVNGRNEDDDNTDETGFYLQSESEISFRFTFIGSLRFDHLNPTNEHLWSPRAALLYKPAANHVVRFTYNRAFSSPPNNTLFLDLLVASVPAPPPLSPIIGSTLFNLRAEGTTSRGFSFSYGAEGRADMVSLYGDLLAQAGLITSAHSYLASDVNSVWPILRQLAIASAPSGQQARLNEVLPLQLSTTVHGVYATLNPATQQFDAIDPSSITDVLTVKPTPSTTFEIGYKGLIDQNLLLTVDVYHSTFKDFIAPLAIATPHVFIDPSTLVPVLVNDMVAQGMDSDSALAIANNIAQTFGPIPIGLVSPLEVQNPTDVILTYRNFGTISLGGLDVGVTYNLGAYWVLGVNYSYISKNLFPKSADQPYDIPLNAPQHKFGAKVEFHHEEIGLHGQLRFHYVDGFPFSSGVYVGDTHSRREFDLSLGYVLPFSRNTRATLTVTNLFNELQQHMIGTPNIGRIAMLRLTHSF